MSNATLIERLAEVNRQIAEYPYWGAALTALSEEQRGLEREIAAMRARQRGEG